MPDEDIRRAYWLERNSKSKEDVREKDLAALGYSPEQIEAIKAEIHGKQ